MLVIQGLVEDASRTDAQIGDLYGLNKGTVASIRNRLTDSGAIYYVNVPALNKLGCEMICYHSGVADPTVSTDLTTTNYMDFVDRSPRVFGALVGGSSAVLHTAFKDAADLERFRQSHLKFFSGAKKPAGGKLDTVTFPFAVTRGTFTPNFAPLVANFFQLDVRPPKARQLQHAEVESPDLSDNERKTLVTMVEKPSASDREIAATLKLSRQAVTRVRNRLTDDGFITLICIPRLYKWGFEIYATAHAKFSMDVPWEKRIKDEPKETATLSFFTLSKANEAVTSYMIPRFQTYMENLESVMAWYHKIKVLDGNPDIKVFALERCTELRTFEYGPLIRDLLLGK